MKTDNSRQPEAVLVMNFMNKFTTFRTYDLRLTTYDYSP